MFSFDPDAVAALEADGWRAYYERRWGLVLRLILIVCQEQFHIPFPVSLVAAYHATRAAQAFAPVRHDTRAVRASYARFYRLARRYSGLHFDPEHVAALELEYNLVHRQLVGVPDKSAFIDSMTRLHAALFGLSLEQARASAEERVRANTLVDRITSGESTDPAADWARIQAALERCYRSIQAHLPTQPADQPNGPAYAFTSTWEVDAPIETVWNAIYDSLRWPLWWPFVAAVEELAPGDVNGTGAILRYTWSTRLPYTLSFDSRITKVHPPRVLEAAASGELNGVGCWVLTPVATGTHVRYDWTVRTRVGWMNALAPIARPVFAWNHHAVMRSGAHGLGRWLGVRARVRAETSPGAATQPPRTRWH